MLSNKDTALKFFARLRQLGRWVAQQRQQRLHPAYGRLKQNPLARLTSLEEVPVATALGVHIDVNQATVDDWLRLPGLSIHQARTLVALSHSGVLFYCLEDIAAALGLPVTRLRPLEPLLQFCYYEAASVVNPVALWVNQATVSQLLSVPGLTGSLATRIVAERRHSPFCNWEEFRARLQLSPSQVSNLLHYLRV